MRYAYEYEVRLTIVLEREDTTQKPGEASIRHAIIDHLLNGSPFQCRLVEVAEVDD